jgi:DNA-binding CsgD family transcriptional regulator
MDVLTLILRTVRQTIEASGAPPDALQDWLSDAECSVRRSFGGSTHHISRLPHVPNKARIIGLAAEGLTPQQISTRLGVTDRYVRMVLAELRGA